MFVFALSATLHRVLVVALLMRFIVEIAGIEFALNRLYIFHVVGNQMTVEQQEWEKKEIKNETTATKITSRTYTVAVLWAIQKILHIIYWTHSEWGIREDFAKCPATCIHTHTPAFFLMHINHEWMKGANTHNRHGQQRKKFAYTLEKCIVEHFVVVDVFVFWNVSDNIANDTM